MPRAFPVCLLALAAAALLLPDLARAGDPLGLGGKKRQEKRQTPRDFVHGEIAALEENTFRLRPWDPDLPGRLLVLPSATTGYRRQERGGQKDLKPGDLVALIEEPRDYPRLPSSATETPEERKVREARESALKAEVDAQPGRLRAVLQLWPEAIPERDARGEDEEKPDAGERRRREAPAEDEAEPRVRGRGGPVVRALLFGAAGHFRGKNRGGTDRPRGDNPVLVGTVKTVNPLVAVVGKRELTFRPQRDTVWLRHPAIKPDELRKSKTVLVLAEAPPGADATLQAKLVVVTPEPLRSAQQQRKLILRDRR